VTDPEVTSHARPARELILTRYVSDSQSASAVNEAVEEICGLISENTCDDPQLEYEHDGSGLLITGRYIRNEEANWWSNAP
jgi:hypothetical protein